ncbi:MAG: hypothetical protein P4L53_09725 [Candidatus Obscuribacterales bacterium]|nr:hypothetical protein [Candidatus Obscuribacterales bacterium]
MNNLVSRTLAVQTCIMSGIGFALAANFVFGQNLIGYDLPSSVFVGAVIGGLIAVALGVTDFLTYYAGRTKDFLAFNLIGLVTGVTIYNWNVLAHMNTSGWTVFGVLFACTYGLLCGNSYAASLAAVKKIAR